jgi:hypothetical protein
MPRPTATLTDRRPRPPCLLRKKRKLLPGRPIHPAARAGKLATDVAPPLRLARASTELAVAM